MISYPTHTGFMRSDDRPDRMSRRKCIAVVSCVSLTLWTVIAVMAVRFV